MATNPNEVGGWVIDSANPRRATYKDEYGDTYEIFEGETTPRLYTPPQEASPTTEVPPQGLVEEGPDAAPQTPAPQLMSGREFGDQPSLDAMNKYKLAAGETASVLDQMIANPNFSEEQIREYATKAQQSGGFTVNRLDEALKARSEGKSIQQTVLDERFDDPLSQQEPGAVAGERRGGLSRLEDNLQEASQYGFPGWVARSWQDWADTGKEQLKQLYPGHSDEWYEDMQGFVVNNAQKMVRQKFQEMDANDPSWRQDESVWENIAAIDRWGAAFVGQALGSTGPESLINPGASRLARVGSQVGVGAASDAGYQALDYMQGISDELDVESVLMNAATAGATQGAFETPGFVRDLFKSRLKSGGGDTTPSADPFRTYQTPEGVEPVVLDPTYTTRAGNVRPVTKKMKETAHLQRGQAHVKALTQDWTNAPSFNVVNSLDDLAPDVRTNVPDDAIGAYLPNGEVLINMKNVDHPSVITSAVFHEGLAHHGLAQRFGEDLPRMMEEIYQNSKGNFKKEVDDWISKNPDYYPEGTPNQIGLAVEELLAKKSEKGQINTTVFNRIRNWLKDYARQMGIDLKFSDREIRTILGMAHDAAINGAPSAAENGFRLMTRRDRILSTSRQLEQTAPGETQSVRPFPEDEPDHFRYRHVTEDGEVITGSYTLEGNKLEDFSISTEKGPRSIGPRTIRKLGRDLLSSHPEATSISGYRMTGARERPEFAESGSRFMRREKEPIEEIPAGRDEEGYIPATLEDIDYELSAFKPNRNISWDETEQAALDRGLTPSRIAKQKGLGEQGALTSRVYSANLALDRQKEKILGLGQQMADEGYSVALNEKMITQFAELKAIHARVNGDSSELGRALNILKKAKQNRGSVGKLLDEVDMDLLSNPEEFMKLMRMIKELKDSGNEDGVTKLVADIFKPKAEDLIFRAYYNMMLSSPATHTTNFLGTGGNFLYDLMENTGAMVIGQAKRFRNEDGSLSLSSNADRIRAREVAYRVWGALNALRTASTWSNARESLNTGLVQGRGTDKTGATNVYAGDDSLKGFASGVLEAPSRLLAGTDEWWRGVLQMSNMYGLAVRNAGNKGLKGKDFRDEVSNLISNPTKEMVDQTNDYSRVLQFMDKPSAVAKTLRNWQTPRPGDDPIKRVGKAALKIAAPFVPTPDALIRTAIRRSPLPYERETIAGWKKGGAERDKVKARFIMGSSIAFYVAAMAAADKVTGEGPADYKKRQAWLGSHQPNSVKIGDTWYSYDGLEPVSTNIKAIATLAERRKAGEIGEADFATQAKATVLGIANVLSDNSYLPTINSFVGSLDQDEAKAQSALDNFFAGTVSNVTTPAVVRKYAQAEDTAIRDTTGDGSFGDRVTGRVKAGIPGQTEDLPQKYDVYGRPMERSFAGLDIATRMATKPVETDPVIQEIARLEGGQKGVLLGAPGKSNIKVDGVSRRLTAEEYQKYQGLSGFWIVEAMRKEMASPDWNSMTDNERKDLISDIKDDVRKMAREYLFNPEGEEEEQDAIDMLEEE